MLENYQQLATQKVAKTIGYLAKLMVLFSVIASTAVTAKFMAQTKKMVQEFDEKVSLLSFEENNLTVIAKELQNNPIILEDFKNFHTKIVIDTKQLNQSQIEEYTNDIDGYTIGMVILKDKIILKSNRLAATTQIPYSVVAQQYPLNNLQKQDILNLLEGRQAWTIGIAFFFIMTFYLFVIYFSTVLLDAIFYSLLGYIEGMISKLRLRYSAVYNIAVHAMTLPILLNLIYFVVNVLTGFTIRYFQIMYTAITCIYIIAAILMIKADVIKKQMELSKIIEEQEKVRQEMLKKEQEEKEEQEKEQLRKEDEKKRREEKKKEKEQQEENSDTPQPEANFNTTK